MPPVVEFKLIAGGGNCLGRWHRAGGGESVAVGVVGVTSVIAVLVPLLTRSRRS